MNVIIDSKYVRAAHSFYPSFYDVRPRVWVDGVLWLDSPIVEAQSKGCAKVTLQADLSNPNPNHKGYHVTVCGADDYGFVRRFYGEKLELAMCWFNRIPSPIDESWLMKHDFECW